MERYQEQDRALIDYALYELPGVKPHPQGGVFRGPPVAGESYVACIGAAQTFGRFARLPYPVLLREHFGIETLNLGSGGAGPGFHNSNRVLLEYINNARLAVVQVLSGRSESNSRFRIKFHGAWGVRLSDGVEMSAEEFFDDLLRTRPDQARAVVTDTRRNYVNNMIRLLTDIKVPKILFWFSTRTPEYHEVYEQPAARLFGDFPQLVTRRMVEEVRAHADGYVECVSRRGLPHLLTDESGRAQPIWTVVGPERRTRTTHNSYYPSAEMHADAADVLGPVCLRYMRHDAGRYLDVRANCTERKWLRTERQPRSTGATFPPWLPGPPPARRDGAASWPQGLPVAQPGLPTEQRAATHRPRPTPSAEGIRRESIP